MNPATASKLAPKILEKLVHTTNIATNMNECLWVGDRRHKTIYVNPVFEKLSGYPLSEAIGKDCTFFFDNEGKKMIETHHKIRHIGRASQYEANLVTKNGKKIPLLISGAPTDEGGTIGIFTNLTKLKKLSRQEKIAEQIVRNSQEAIVVLDKKRHIKLWNSGATKIFGFSEKEVLNKEISIIIPPSQEYANLSFLEEVEKKNYIKNCETKRITKTGKLVDVTFSVTKVTDEKKNFIGYLVIYADITEQKKSNTELQKRFEAIQDAYKELGLQKRKNDYIAEITNVATSDESLGVLENLIVSAACMLTKCDGAILRRHNSEKGILKFCSSIGVSQKWLAKNQIKFKNSLAEEAFEKKRPIILQNVAASTKHQGIKLLKEHGFKTLILIPLFINKTFLGTISLYATSPAKFRLIEREFLERFGKQCSLALYSKIS
jgi:PAS domain S-box-containing protein